MSDDSLERAASAVRARYDGQSASSAATEARVLQRVRRRAAPRRWFPLVVIPLAATLLASAAWGAVTGKLFAVVREVGEVFAARPSRPPTPAKLQPAPALASAPVAEPAASAATTSETPAPEVAVHEPPLGRPHARVARSAPLEPSAQPIVVPEPAPDPNALFRIANRAQFTGHDPAAAVELWDHYLSAAPNGSLAPEARYNRAIALTQLGRKAEAAAALQPFARGDYGTYRQTEAQQLLKALGQ